MSLKDILKENPLVLAPMAGITDFPFRLICKELGAGLVFSEMVSVEALIREHRRTKGMLHTNPAERPVVFQIFGSKPRSMAEAVRIISQGGVDCIDVNMGCPVPKILKSGAGAALLRDIGLAKEIMTAVVGASKVPVSVKIRLGWDANSLVAPDLARIAESVGVSALIVHGRTKAQGFSGHADWNAIARVKAAVNIPVIGNGDVRTALDAKKLLDETGCDGVMIGRAAQGYPWIFREAKQYLKTGALPDPPSHEERHTLMRRHFDDMIRLVGESAAIREMRKHLCWYTKGLHGGADFREKVNRRERADEVKKEISDFFSRTACAIPAACACSADETMRPY